MIVPGSSGALTSTLTCAFGRIDTCCCLQWVADLRAAVVVDHAGRWETIAA